MRVIFLMVLVALSLRSEAQFWGAKAPRPIDTPKDSLKRGEFTWAPELSPEGPILVTVNLDEQYAYTYRNGVLIGIATVSTGKPGHQTPTGVFVTTLKDAKHRSSKYNNAAMPYTQRFTSDGIALHAGGVPNYPSSHGCVHLPSEYARLLFKESPLGMTVVVTDKSKNPVEVSHPSFFLTPVYTDGKVQPHERLSEKEAYRWNPEKSPTGPVSMVISGADKRMVVLRNGVEIGRCKLTIINEADSLGTHFYVVQADENASGAKSGPSVQINWLAMPLEDLKYDETTSHPFLEHRIKIPGPFLKELETAFVPGTHILVTDAPILAGSTGKKMAVISSYPKGENKIKLPLLTIIYLEPD